MATSLSKPSAADQLIVALDVPDTRAALRLIERLDGRCRWFKVGLELFLAEGPAVVETVRSQGFDVFLDLKLHDIPNTVAGAVRSAARTGASLLTLHAGGGPKMIAAAREAVEGIPNAPKLLAVTVLTSMDAAQLQATGIVASPAEQVMRLARMATSAGADGLVCSAEETAALRTVLAPQTLLVVPGIRPAGAKAGDQSRVATPAQAMERGASYLVVGRPITEAPDPAAAAQAILEEIASAQ